MPNFSRSLSLAFVATAFSPSLVWASGLAHQLESYILLRPELFGVIFGVIFSVIQAYFFRDFSQDIVELKENFGLLKSSLIFFFASILVTVFVSFILYTLGTKEGVVAAIFLQPATIAWVGQGFFKQGRSSAVRYSTIFNMAAAAAVLALIVIIIPVILAALAMTYHF